MEVQTIAVTKKRYQLMNDESMKNHSPSDFKQLKLSSVSVAANIVFVVVIVAGVNGP